MDAQSSVYVVDDDTALQDSLRLLFESVRLPMQAFASCEEFLESYDGSSRGCVLLDLRLPGMSGLDLQRELHRRGARLRIIVLTGHGDVGSAVEALRSGAIDYLQKPFSPQELLDRVQLALADTEREAVEDAAKMRAASDLARLTPRERQVLVALARGERNAQIARHLGISRKTVEFHRSRLMHKTAVGSLAELIRLAVLAGIDRDAEPGRRRA
jgi:FixJ family two-component response regulator